MISKPKPELPQKENLHRRNLHRSPYDFKALIQSCSDLAPFVMINKYQNESIDFTDPNAVKFLNKAILHHFYQIRYWDIPDNYLCPPIPGRADYIHYIADLLNVNANTPSQHISGLDIGVGANCVYPIIGHQSYGWTFVGSDVDPKALQSAQKIVDSNPALTPFIECRLQQSPSHIFTGIVQPSDKFSFTMCNPPFHTSLEEARAGTFRKWKNLGRNSNQKGALNFGGQHSELWYPGGELAFINKMIEESSQIAQQCQWFTSLVSKKTTLPALYQSLRKVKAIDIKTIQMSQGQKTSRILAWTFLDDKARKAWSHSK